MRKYLQIFFILFLAFRFSSCKKEDVAPQTQSIKIDSISRVLVGLYELDKYELNFITPPLNTLPWIAGDTVNFCNSINKNYFVNSDLPYKILITYENNTLHEKKTYLCSKKVEDFTLELKINFDVAPVTNKNIVLIEKNSNNDVVGVYDVGYFLTVDNSKQIEAYELFLDVLFYNEQDKYKNFFLIYIKQ